MKTFDIAALENNYKGMESLIHSLVKSVLSHVPQQIQAMKITIDSKDLKEIGAAAHKLRGSLCTIFAERSVELCKEMENSAKKGDLSCIEANYPTLNAELLQLSQELMRYLNTLDQ